MALTQTKPLNINRSLINDDVFISNAKRYLTRKYGNEKGNELLRTADINDIDFKTIECMCKLNTSYSTIQNKRVKAVVIEYKQDPNISAITPKANKANKATPVVICKAIKMNGQPCCAKVKVGMYCARHSKK